ncbi:unnamed protein product [Durusdinium trenchii]|uniref:Uncharacterized protein n=2 Tax=Durusdinium trenchii TaxID=1381693 RepID=A0ABP0KCP8_9DINO
MAQHLLDAVPRRLRFTPGSTRNLLLRNISKGDLVLQIDLDHPFLLELGCHQESTVLPPGETLAFRLRAQAAASRVVGGTFSVHIDGPTPPLLVELLLAPEEASEEELQRCAQQAREAQQARAREARVKPEAVQMQMGDAEEKRGVQLVPAVLAEYLGEAPSAAALRGGLRLGAAAAGDTPDTPGTPRSEHSAALPDGHVRGALEEGDERPPTPTPEEFREAFAKAPSAPVAPIAPELEMAGPEVTVRQVVQFDLPARSREEPSGALEASYEHVSSKLTPAEATRIAALRAKGLLKEGAEVPQAPVPPPPKPAGFEESDLFYVEGSGWCDIYGRTVGDHSFSGFTRPTQSVGSGSVASSPRSNVSGSPSKRMPREIKASRKAQQAAWDAIPGI